jgi:hypothetical protein
VPRLTGHLLRTAAGRIRYLEGAADSRCIRFAGYATKTDLFEIIKFNKPTFKTFTVNFRHDVSGATIKYPLV